MENLEWKIYIIILKLVSPTEADKISKKYNYNLFVKI